MIDDSFRKTSCTHCGGHIEYPPEAVGMTVPCPHCFAATTLPGNDVKGRPSHWRWVFGLGILLLVGASAGWFLFHFQHPNADLQSSVIPQPPPADLQRLKELAFWDIALERKEGSTITHAVGRVLNESKHTRYGIEIHLQIADELGRPVGNAKDYIERLDAGQNGHFRALVIKREAATARVIRVTEQ